jgi:PAS domain S-box-containing protein
MNRGRPTSSAADLAAIVESSDDAILSTDLDGVIESCNAAGERNARAKRLGQNIRVLLPPERLDEEHAILASIRRGERVEHFDTVQLTKSSQPIDVSLTISPVRDEAGDIIGASKIQLRQRFLPAYKCSLLPRNA